MNVHPCCRGRCQSCNQVPATHVQRVWQELRWTLEIIHVKYVRMNFRWLSDYVSP